MAIAVIPCALITGFWAVIGIIAPIFIPKGPNKGIIQLSLVLTAFTCWLFLMMMSLHRKRSPPVLDLLVTTDSPVSWLCTYMSQMNPLIGPKLKRDMLLNIAREWGNAIIYPKNDTTL